MSDNSNNRKGAISGSNNYSGRQYFRDNLRVLRKNLLFCSGLPLSLTEGDIRSEVYFGKYGEVTKVIMLRNMKQMSVYVTYSDAYQASLAIIATNDFQFDRYHKLASIYGTIKYCKYFLKRIQCKNLPNCNYLHVHDKKNQIYIDNQLPDQVFEEHYKIALKLLKQMNVTKMIKEKNLQRNTVDDILPCPIQALDRISKIKLPALVKYVELVSPQGSSQSFSSSLSSRKGSSQQETSQTVVPQVHVRNEQSNKEQFPKKSLLMKKQVDISNINNSINNCMNSSINKPQNNQTLEIKLIRKLVRQPRSKLHNWTDCYKNKQQIQQINPFHRQLSELNQLRQLCQSNILKEKNKQQQRLKFLLIKNIHHKKHHYAHHINHVERNFIRDKAMNFK